MPNINDILKDKLTNLETIPANFISNVQKDSSKVFSQILKRLNDLQLDNQGNIILNDYNLAQIEILGEELQGVIYQTGYLENLQKFAAGLDSQKSINVNLLKETIGKDFELDAVYNRLYDQSKKSAIELLGDTAVRDNVDEFKSILQNSISQSSSYTDLINNIKTNIEGNDEVEGYLERYANQYANDLYAITDRTFTTKVAEDFGVQFYEYSGSTISTTRCFCRERVGRIFHKEEIKSWGRKENLGDCNTGGGWAGMSRETNESTIFSLLGGYNCLHSLIPISVDQVPDDVLEDAIDKGYINLEEEE